MTVRDRLIAFIRESNRIEGLHHAPTDTEIDAHMVLLTLRTVPVPDLEVFVGLIQPGAVLRRTPGQDVRVGQHVAPPGGPAIDDALRDLLADTSRGDSEAAYVVHGAYESLHPFTDGNGRSGRALWLWMMGGLAAAPLGFLHHWYYQSLEAERRVARRADLRLRDTEPDDDARAKDDAMDRAVAIERAWDHRRTCD